MVACAWPPAAGAQRSGDVVRIGVLTDMHGALSDLTGAGSVTAVRMAVEDFGGKVLGRPIEIVEADHRNLADVASTIARDWIEHQGVDMITDLANSAVALAVSALARDEKRIAIVNGAGTTRLTNAECSPTTVQYAWDTWAMAHGPVRTLVRQGGTTWYFITADYAFGRQIEKEVRDVVTAAGGKVLGSTRLPLNTEHFERALQEAQRSGAEIIALANGGADTIRAIRAAQKLGIATRGRQRLAALALFLPDVHSLGLRASQGLVLTTGFYWDRNDASRQWARRFFALTGRMPTVMQAGDYSSTIHYLRAVQAEGTTSAAAVMARMQATPVDDFFARDGRIRPDGRMVHDMFLVQVKKPGESKYPWDYFRILATIPAAEAFQPLAQSTCPLVRR